MQCIREFSNHIIFGTEHLRRMTSTVAKQVTGRMVECAIFKTVIINYKLFKNQCISGTSITLANLEHSEVCRYMYKLQVHWKTSASYPKENT